MNIYEWVDSLPLSRSKKNISKDFCDAGLLAEIIKHYYPKLVDLHNYPPGSSSNQKCYNWTTLDNKVLKKMGILLKKQEINDAITCKSMAIEHILQKVYAVIEKDKGKIALGGKNDGDVEGLKKVLEEKRNQLKIIIGTVQDLEIKLESSNDYKQTLENKINELSLQLQQQNKS